MGSLFPFLIGSIMTSRVYHVCRDHEKFRIQIRTTYAKARKRKLVELRGYPCSNSANNDVTRLIRFFQSERSRITDFKSCYTDVSNCRNLAVKANYAQSISDVRGIIKREKDSRLMKEYNTYKKMMDALKEACLSVKEWTTQQDQIGFDKERFMRRYYRDPRAIQLSISKGLLSQNDSEIVDSLNASVSYFTDRLSVLREQAFDYLANLKVLRAAIFFGKTFTLLMKAKFENDDEDEFKDVIDLSSDDEFTLSNISKAQLARSIQQCQLVEKVYLLVSEKVANEISLIQKVTAEIAHPKFNILTSVDIIQQHWNRIKEFKINENNPQVVPTIFGRHILTFQDNSS